MSSNNSNKATTLLAVLALLASAASIYIAKNPTVTARVSETPTISGSPVAVGGGTPSLAPMLKIVQPAVVNIAVTVKLPPQLPGSSQKQFHNSPDESPDEPEDGQGAPQGDQGGDGFGHGVGSGVIVDAAKGYIVTNNHVVDSAESIKVKLKDDREFDAVLIGTDPESDLAVVQIKADHLTQLPIADSDTIQVGDWVAAIGSPFALTQTVTAGIVSALGRETPSPDGGEGISDFIQTDASINPGNSGGALVNLKGELVGIPSQILSRSGGNVGIGFAIPTNLVKIVMKELIANGKVVRGRLGLGLQEIDPKLAKAFNLTDTHGAIITKVEPGSTAEKAGMKAKDVVLAADGHEMLGIQQLHNYVATLHVGDHVTLKVIRDGKPIEVSVEVGLAPEQVVAANGKVMKSKLAGVTLAEVRDGARRGLLASAIDPQSVAAGAGLALGDVIVSIDSKPVVDLAWLSAYIKDKKNDKLLLQVQRDGRLLFVALQ